jgi:hypothetical protein
MPLTDSNAIRKKLPDRRLCETLSFEFDSHRYITSFSHFPGTTKLAEIFLDSGKPNTMLQIHASDSAVLVSLLLQHGVDLESIRHSISGPIKTALCLIPDRRAP